MLPENLQQCMSRTLPDTFHISSVRGVGKYDLNTHIKHYFKHNKMITSQKENGKLNLVLQSIKKYGKISSKSAIKQSMIIHINGSNCEFSIEYWEHGHTCLK